jgi:hypothetical protein
VGPDEFHGPSDHHGRELAPIGGAAPGEGAPDTEPSPQSLAQGTEAGEWVLDVELEGHVENRVEWDEPLLQGFERGVVKLADVVFGLRTQDGFLL